MKSKVNKKESSCFHIQQLHMSASCTLGVLFFFNNSAEMEMGFKDLETLCVNKSKLSLSGAFV